MPDERTRADDLDETEEDDTVILETGSSSGFYRALAEVLAKEELTDEFTVLVRKHICVPLAKKRPAELVVGGRKAVKEKGGTKSDIGETDPVQTLAQDLWFGALHKLPDGGSEYDPDGNPVPRELNLPLLRKYFDEATLRISKAERDALVFKKLWRRAHAEWQTIEHSKHPLTKLRQTMRDKLDNAVVSYCEGKLEIAKLKGGNGDGVLRPIASKSEPRPDLNINSLVIQLGLVKEGRGVLRGNGSKNDHVPGLPDPAQMGKLLTTLLLAAPDPPPLEAISVFQFVDLCFRAFDIPVPGKVEPDEDRQDEGEPLPPDGIPIPQDKQTKPITPEIGVEPEVRQVVERLVGLVRSKDVPFSVGDLVNLPSLATKLRQPSRAFDKWLAAQLSSATRKALAIYQGQSSNEVPFRKAMVKDLNQILCGSSIYEKQRFADVTLHSETQTLIAGALQGRNLQFLILNRLLIEDAYPLEVSTSHLPENPPSDLNHLNHLKERCKYQLTLAQGVLWLGQDLWNKGKYQLADFVRISGYRESRAYERCEDILHWLKNSLETLPEEQHGVALSLLMSRFLPWKPEIVADPPLKLPGSSNVSKDHA